MSRVHDPSQVIFGNVITSRCLRRYCGTLPLLESKSFKNLPERITLLQSLLICSDKYQVTHSPDEAFHSPVIIIIQTISADERSETPRRARAPPMVSRVRKRVRFDVLLTAGSWRAHGRFVFLEGVVVCNIDALTCLRF